jgi:tetratricopeptide (TPR) repeat protein
VLERLGRVDEAVDLLQEKVHHRNSTSTNIVEQLADVLARHGRHDELRALINGYGKEYAAKRFALHLESIGDVEGALALLEPMAAGGARNASVYLAETLIRAGLGEEGLAVVRRALPGDPECLLSWWRELMVERGRAEEALAVVDEMAQGSYGLTENLYGERLCLLVHAGREEEAIQAVAARSDDEWEGAEMVGDALVAVGRIDQALEVFERARDRKYFQTQIATLKARQGRVEEALAVLPREKGRQLIRPYTLH